MLPAPRLPRNTMIVLSLAQGLGLLLLWRALTHETWPSQIPTVNFPLWTFVIVWPVLLLLSLEVDNRARIFRLTGAFMGVLILLAVYIGWQASPVGKFSIHSLLFVYSVTLTIACFKALMYLQQRAGGLPMTYEVLFAFSWRNFLVAAFAGAFMGGVSALLALWAALFLVIDIDFFRELFSKDWFQFPVLAVAFGIGVFVFRRLTGVIDGITGLLEGLIRLLLPLVIIIMVIFLAALPFTGLTPLWETGRGTALLLWLNAVVLFFINAVYQIGRHTPYPQVVQRLLYPGIALLPIVSVLALYGLYLRVDQYGWTVARCWALAVTILLGMFSCGYLWGIIRRRSAWTTGLAHVNVVMGWVVLALMLLVNSPLLDFRSISLASQLGRVDAGELELNEFDFYYVRRHLARPGFLALQTLIAQLEVSDPELAERISISTGPVWSYKAEIPDDFWERVTFRPERFDVPADLQIFIENRFFQPFQEPQKSGQDDQGMLDPGGESDTAWTPKAPHPPPAMSPVPVYGDSGSSATVVRDPAVMSPVPVYGEFGANEMLALGETALSLRSTYFALYRNPVFIQVDLNNDGVLEYALISSIPGASQVFGLCFYLADGVWNYRRLSLISSSLTANVGTSDVDISDVLHHGEIETMEPAFRELRVGELVLQVR